MTTAGPAMNPPIDASDLLSVPMTKSGLSVQMEVFRGAATGRAERPDAVCFI